MANWMHLGMVGVNLPRTPTQRNNIFGANYVNNYISEDPMRQHMMRTDIERHMGQAMASNVGSIGQVMASNVGSIGQAMASNVGPLGQAMASNVGSIPTNGISNGISNSVSNSYSSYTSSLDSLSHSNTVEQHESSSCAKMPGLVSKQLQVCEGHPNAMYAVSEGAKRAIQECQKQFKNERWNCTTEGDKSVFGHTLQRGSRETAFVYAITSAGVVHAISQACSAGNLTECSCDLSPQGHNNPEGWKWGGCSDNIRYGMQFAKTFVDAPERAARKKNRDIRAMMNLHNNLAGRLSIQNQMELKCRCHGVSGSCELKTCWRTLPPFSQVGHVLKQKYESSVQISPKARKRLRPKGKVKRKVPVSKEDLVHIHKSPNFCIQDYKKGILGTTGRQCNKTSTGPESCNLLCCGRGYNTQIFRQVERCQCRFHWCCFVTCSVCEQMVEVYTCK
ncbi:protein Wnt-16-like [Oppia nitens]|uniref:protein Wnt-16-like n=1 Tax=Oppia nitens TaxID=1686743 RepID=UPI0023DC9D91|nr:protein Wnt-16-like [Oppia nitens]